MKEVTCLNCRHVQQITPDKVFEDEMGTYTICEKCDSSFDI